MRELSHILCVAEFLREVLVRDNNYRRNLVNSKEDTTREMKLLIVLCVCMLSYVTCEPNQHDVYHVTPVTDRPGLYYERVVTLRLQHVDWRVAVFIDLQKFIASLPEEELRLTEALEKCREVTFKMFYGSNFPRGKCSELLNTNHLLSRVAHARALANELSRIAQDSMLIKPLEDLNLRTMKKRSVPLGFIGSLSKSLFGTMNEEDAEYINSQIDKLFSDQANITKLIGRQMHLTGSILQQLHEDHLAETKRVEDIDNRIKDLWKTLGGITKDTAELIFRVELVNFARRVEIKIDRYIDACEQYLRVITAARDGRYHPAVLTTAQLSVISREIRDRAAEFEFPLANEYLRGELLARVAHADLTYHSGRLLIIAHIPLLDRMSYNLYRMHPWPVPQTATNMTGSAHVTPSTTYIAVSYDRRNYFLADDIYVAGCSRLEHKYICTMEMPLHEVSTSEQCEITMLTRPSVEAYRSCNVRIRPQHGASWIHLPTQGGWLYSLNEREQIHILCPGLGEITTTLQGAGVFHLSPNCVGRTRTTALTGIRAYDSREQYFYTPDVSLNVTIMVPELLELPKIASSAIMTELSEEKDTRKITESWKLEEDGESLFDIEQRIAEIGTHRREKQRQHYLFLAGFSFQGLLIALLIFCFCGPRIWRRITCPRHLKRRDDLGIGNPRRESNGEEQNSKIKTKVSTKKGYRSPRAVRGNSASATFNVESEDVVISSGCERRNKTLLRSLPPQDAEVD